MTSNLRQLIQAKDLLWTWVGRIIRARYQQSVLGGLWAIVQPLATVAIFSVIFTLFVPIDTGGPPYVVFSYVALVPWTLFAASLTDMTNSLVENMTLVNKVYFPREVLPVASVAARLVDFAIAAGVLVILMIYFQLPLFLLGLVFLPIILIIQIALVLGLGLITAAVNVFYRDARYLLTLAVQIWFYASPIIYPVSRVPEGLRPFYFLNPMAGALEAYRDVLLYERLPGPYLLISALVALVALVIGYWYFKRVEFQFADIV